MKRFSFCLLLSLTMLATFSIGGCGDSANTVIEQPAQPVTPEFQAEENAAINQPSTN